jgi:hypothetical protein
MKRICKRCLYEGSLSDKIMRFSNIINEWLCDDCHELARNEFFKFRENFIELKKNKDVVN